MLTISVILFLVLTYGVVAGGSRRWIDLGDVNIQPSEFAKPIIILFIAYHLSNIESDKSDFYNLRKALTLPALCSILVLLEPDFGTTLTISGIILMQLLFSEIKLRLLSNHSFFSLFQIFCQHYLILKLEIFLLDQLLG